MKLKDRFKRFAGNISIIEDKAQKEIYTHDIGELPSLITAVFFNIFPYFVVQPENEDDIRRTLIFANDNNIPVIPRGAASWGFGGVMPVYSGIVIDLSTLRKIKSLNKHEKTITVETGARWSDIDNIAKKDGLCLMTYPSSKFSTVGGWIATGGYGINSFRYGHLSKQIDSLKFISPKGETKKITPADPEFKYIVSSEGQFGIIYEITIKLKDTPKAAYSRLFYLKNDSAAFEFADRFIKEAVKTGDIQPDTIRILDKNHLCDMNEIIHSDIFKQKPAVLIELDNSEDNEKLRMFLSSTGPDIEEAPGYVANYLWNERFFGMKAKRLGPTILASEIIIPINRSGRFIEKAKRLGSHFGAEIGIDTYIINESDALIMATFLCDSRKLKYTVNLSIVSMLTRIAVASGAKPYGLGVWNTPFINYLLDKNKIRDLKKYKKKVDPKNIMNRGKFFSMGSKFFNLPSIVFNPLIFNILMTVMVYLSPVTGRIIALLLGRNKKAGGELDIKLSTYTCAKCGSCLAVCPAYLITGDERVTPKGKIAFAKKFLAGAKTSKEESDNIFLCMHCKACEEICQTNLGLVDLWETIEKELEKKFGAPKEKIMDFLKKVDESEEYWEMVERNG